MNPIQIIIKRTDPVRIIFTDQNGDNPRIHAGFGATIENILDGEANGGFFKGAIDKEEREL